MLLFDTHAHLESPRFDVDRAQVIARAQAAGVARILTCGSDLATSQASIELAHGTQGLFAAVGVHGHQAASVVLGDPAREGDWCLDEQAFARLAALARAPGVVALGEIGLDYHYDFSPRPVQRAVLERQLLLAADLGLPVVLHNREADADTRALLEAAPAELRGVLHCFLADLAMAEWALARGLYLGVAGPITFKNVPHLPEVVRAAPLERLLIETDAPYLAPHPRRGARTEPAFVVHVAARLAEVLGLAPDELARATWRNACRLFGLD
ncbi:MAG: TatD family hydrolase [Anaerolineae bacterium]